jgi:hypothetical protein
MLDVTRDELRTRCLKPDSDRIGTWTARRLARPIALRITRVVLPTGISAHQTTLFAALAALAAACGLAHGTPGGWLCGAVLLEVWYVFDHVDGQLARWHRTASLDGTTLDYLMHHGVNLIVPQAIALGLVRLTGEPTWFVLGTAWSWGLVTAGLRHDARYKSFIQRLKSLDGELTVVGGGGGRRVPGAWPRPNIRDVASWCVQKVCEMHVLAHLLLVIAVGRLLLPDRQTEVALTSAALLTVPASAVGDPRRLRSEARRSRGGVRRLVSRSAGLDVGIPRRPLGRRAAVRSECSARPGNEAPRGRAIVLTPSCRLHKLPRRRPQGRVRARNAWKRSRSMSWC